MRKIFNILAVTFVGFFLHACMQNEPAPLRLGSNLWVGYEPLFLARELGHYDETSVDLIEFVSASEVIRSFRNNVIDAAALTLDEALLLQDSNIDIKIILITDYSNGGDAIIANDTIKNFSDIAGKRVGVEGTALGAYTLTRAMEINGLALSDVIIHQIEADQHEDTFGKGLVDAVVTFEPTKSRLMAQKGNHEIFSSKEIPGEIVDVIVVKANYIDAHSQHIIELLEGWFQALHFYKNSREKALSLMNERLKIPPKQLDAAFAGLQFISLEANIAMLTQGDSQLHKTMTQLQRVMVENNLVKKNNPIDNLFSPIILKVNQE